MSTIDLHIHSNFSDDGELSPLEIVTRCKKQRMELIAITDHNSVRGVAKALSAADELQVISGIELDCTCGGQNLHLLGYGFDHTRKEFAAVEQDILKQERAAAEEKIFLFKKATGIPLSVSEVLCAAEGGVVTGELIAELVLEKKNAGKHELLRPYLPGGAKSDMPNVRFYWDFFSEGKPAYVPINYLSLPEASELIHSTGGIAVLAHPGQNLAGNDELLYRIIAEKIDGIEVFSSYHSQEIAAHYLEVAERSRLLVTCGSDFHGKHKPNIPIGGHNATWNDQRLLSEIRSRLLGKL